VTIIDFHTHVAPPWVQDCRAQLVHDDACFAALYADPRARLATVDELIASMDEAGVSASVVLNLGWTTDALCARTNDYLLEGGARWPGRIIPFVAVQPADPESAAREMERCIAAGARGIGELRPDIQGFSLADTARLRPVAEMAARHGLPVLVHVSEPVGHSYPGKGTVTPEQPYGFARSFPGTALVCAHWGGGLPFYSLMPEVRRTLAQVFFDSAASHYLYSRDVFRVVAGLVGADHILMGSDFPLIRQQRAIEEVRQADLPVSDAGAILGGNAARLLAQGGHDSAGE
jgi:predicted TIM-barrel fold metal-dependent hydrolase